MNNRLLEIIKYKTGGRQTEFAEIMGWSPQYLAKLLKGANFGLQPVLSIISRFPEINARWLLIGEGDMIEIPKSDIRKTMFENLLKVLDLEKYMPVMSSEELHEYEQTVTGGKIPQFSPKLIKKWQNLVQERESKLNEKFNAATEKSDNQCKQKRAKQ